MLDVEKEEMVGAASPAPARKPYLSFGVSVILGLEQRLEPRLEPQQERQEHQQPELQQQEQRHLYGKSYRRHDDVNWILIGGRGKSSQSGALYPWESSSMEWVRLITILVVIVDAITLVNRSALMFPWHLRKYPLKTGQKVSK